MELILPPSREADIVYVDMPEVLSPEAIARLHREIFKLFPEQTLVLQNSTNENCFCRGMDLVAFSGLSPEDLRAGLQMYADILEKIYTATFVSLAKVEGLAIGGGLALAAACDSVLATNTARFGLPEAIYGFPPAIASVILQQRCHSQAIRKMSLYCDSISAVDALQLGLADQLCDETAMAKKLRYELRRLHRASVSGRASVKTVFSGQVNLQQQLQAAVEITYSHWSNPSVRTHIQQLKAVGQL